MREIKFRAWHKADKDYHNVMEIDLMFRNILTTNMYNYSFNEVILEQFTGFKDKNGKEVYEGDIVRCEPLPFAYEEEESIRYVKFFQGSWVAFLHKSKGCHLIDVLFQGCEVIGNIRERLVK